MDFGVLGRPCGWQSAEPRPRPATSPSSTAPAPSRSSSAAPCNPKHADMRHGPPRLRRRTRLSDSRLLEKRNAAKHGPSREHVHGQLQLRELDLPVLFPHKQHAPSD
eukprot:1364153-Rhodomonas_salina.1